jgi:hypothetical protein
MVVQGETVQTLPPQVHPVQEVESPHDVRNESSLVELLLLLTLCEKWFPERSDYVAENNSLGFLT